MSCIICLQANQTYKGLYNDCIIQSLEKIKVHYLNFKTQYDECHRQIEKLQLDNEELKLNLAAIKSSPKRRKTSSFEDSPSVSEKSTSDSLNDAIKADPSWDESFFVGTQQRTETPKNILKVSNCSPDRNISPSKNALRPSPGGGLLPRRLKSTPVSSRQKDISRTPTGVENRSPKWTSKENIKASDKVGLMKRERSMSFIQPVAPANKASSNSPRVDISGFKSPPKNLLTLKKEANLKQTRLKFDTSRAEVDRDETIVPETDETFCGDLIAASPTSASTGGFETMKSKLKSTRKLNRNRLHSTCASTNKHAPPKLNIKIEPQSAVKKNIEFDEKSTALKPIAEATPPRSSAKSRLMLNDNVSTISGIEPHSDSSLCILPSQSNDVIIVEDSHADSHVDIDSAALFDEMMIKADETSDFLKKIEEKCISNLKHHQDKQNVIARTMSGDLSPAILPTSKEVKLVTIPKTKELDYLKSKQGQEDVHIPSVSKESPPIKNEPNNPPVKPVPQWNCKECESFYSIAGRNMPEQELLKRVKHCQEKHRQTIYGTPEGFWNPCFPPTQEDDPRNKTLSDPKRVLEKKN